MPKKTTDKEGLDQAYSSANSLYRDAEGTLHVAGTRRGLLGSDWMENYKIYSRGLVTKLRDMYGKLDSGKFRWKDWYTTGDLFKIEDTQLYKTVDQYVKDNPGEVNKFRSTQ